jgi:hypothetical protein
MQRGGRHAVGVTDGVTDGVTPTGTGTGGRVRTAHGTPHTAHGCCCC